MTINQVASAQMAYRNLAVNSVYSAKSIRKLSSGYRINVAADDPAGLAVSQKMRGQIGGLAKASENAQHGVSLIQTADGALGSTSKILADMRELAIQASNGTYSAEDRALLNNQFQQLKGSLNGVASSTNFNGMGLLDGTLGGRTGSAGLSSLGISGITAASGNSTEGTAKFTISEEGGAYSITAEINGETVTNKLTDPTATSSTFQLANGDSLTVNFNNVSDLQSGVAAGVEVSANTVNTASAISARSGAELTLQIGANGSADQRMGVHIGDMSALGLGIADLDISTMGGIGQAISGLDNAINQVNAQRSSLGASQNRLEHTVNNLNYSKQNLTAAESRIRDTDMAKEMINFTQRRLQMQASQAMMAQGMRLSQQNMLSLLLR